MKSFVFFRKYTRGVLSGTEVRLKILFCESGGLFRLSVLYIDVYNDIYNKTVYGYDWSNNPGHESCGLFIFYASININPCDMACDVAVKIPDQY